MNITDVHDIRYINIIKNRKRFFKDTNKDPRISQWEGLTKHTDNLQIKKGCVSQQTPYKQIKLSLNVIMAKIFNLYTSIINHHRSFFKFLFTLFCSLQEFNDAYGDKNGECER